MKCLVFPSSEGAAHNKATRVNVVLNARLCNQNPNNIQKKKIVSIFYEYFLIFYEPILLSQLLQELSEIFLMQVSKKLYRLLVTTEKKRITESLKRRRLLLLYHFIYLGFYDLKFARNEFKTF